MSKIKIYLQVYWVCFLYMLKYGNFPPKTLRNWAKNYPNDTDIAMAKSRRVYGALPPENARLKPGMKVSDIDKNLYIKG